MYPSISCLLCHSHFILLCTVSHNVSSIKFDMLHVYKQLYTCLYTHLYMYNQLVIVIFYLYSDCLIHFCIIMYLLCIHHISSHIVYQKKNHPCHIVQSSIYLYFFTLLWQMGHTHFQKTATWITGVSSIVNIYLELLFCFQKIHTCLYCCLPSNVYEILHFTLTNGAYSFPKKLPPELLEFHQ